MKRPFGFLLLLAAIALGLKGSLTINAHRPGEVAAAGLLFVLAGIGLGVVGVLLMVFGGDGAEREDSDDFPWSGIFGASAVKRLFGFLLLIAAIALGWQAHPMLSSHGTGELKLAGFLFLIISLGWGVLGVLLMLFGGNSAEREDSDDTPWPFGILGWFLASLFKFMWKRR